MIDWSELVVKSFPDLPKNEARLPCSDSNGRNNSQNPEKVGTAESLTSSGFAGSVPTVPTVPTIFEGTREERSKNSNPSSFKSSDGGGVEEGFAPSEKALDFVCRRCASFRRPGLSDGYCGGRDDLPPAYTPGHPLRQLPENGGASCSIWQLHPALGKHPARG